MLPEGGWCGSEMCCPTTEGRTPLPQGAPAEHTLLCARFLSEGWGDPGRAGSFLTVPSVMQV